MSIRSSIKVQVPAQHMMLGVGTGIIASPGGFGVIAEVPYDDPEHAHFLTFSCYRRMPLPNNTTRRQILQIVEYFRDNPVRRSLASRAVD